MGRREYWIRNRCAHDGCTEVGHSIASTREEEREARARYAKHPWRCIRHSAPSEVLTPDNPERVTVLTAGPSERYPDHSNLYWNGEGGGSGFQYGPGFKAFARDFPPGTRLVVTARIELPENGDTR